MKHIFKLFLLLTFASYSQDNKLSAPEVFTVDGISVTSYDFEGIEKMLHRENDTIYVVNFWATWCAPCIKELPYFDKINSAYKDKKVKVVLVSLDMKKQITSNLLPFVARKKVQSEVVHLYAPDANSWISKVSEQWSGAIPATVIYTKDKRQFYEQSFTYESLQKEILQFLK